MLPKNCREIIEGWKIQTQEISNGVYKIEVEDKLGRRFEITTSDPETGIEQCRQSALNIEKRIKDRIASFNPWDFSNKSPQTYSHNKTHRIIYHDLQKIKKNGALIGKAYVLDNLDNTKLITSFASGLPIWNLTKNIVAIPYLDKRII